MGDVIQAYRDAQKAFHTSTALGESSAEELRVERDVLAVVAADQLIAEREAAETHGRLAGLREAAAICNKDLRCWHAGEAIRKLIEETEGA